MRLTELIQRLNKNLGLTKEQTETQTKLSTNIVSELREAIKKNSRFEAWNNIYLINNGIIGKKYYYGEKAYTEYNMGTFLFKNDVQVPEMYRLVSPDVPPYSHEIHINNWFVLMQRINGEDILCLERTEGEEGLRQYKQEIGKVLALQIYPGDSSFYFNTIFDTKQGKLYLIDFEAWKKGSPEELNQSRGYIKDLQWEFNLF